ncbi:hypothetical protein FB451DRAFT_1535941 [Mycena latifolia]|nr:hypothetical protein FB451DRAFT_1535941 [Mycena latifolia]
MPALFACARAAALFLTEPRPQAAPRRAAAAAPACGYVCTGRAEPPFRLRSEPLSIRAQSSVLAGSAGCTRPQTPTRKTILPPTTAKAPAREKALEQMPHRVEPSPMSDSVPAKRRRPSQRSPSPSASSHDGSAVSTPPIAAPPLHPGQHHDERAPPSIGCAPYQLLFAPPHHGNSAPNGNGAPDGGDGIPVVQTDDVATKLSDRARRRCFNYCTTNTMRALRAHALAPAPGTVPARLARGLDAREQNPACAYLSFSFVLHLPPPTFLPLSTPTSRHTTPRPPLIRLCLRCSGYSLAAAYLVNAPTATTSKREHLALAAQEATSGGWRCRRAPRDLGEGARPPENGGHTGGEKRGAQGGGCVAVSCPSALGHAINPPPTHERAKPSYRAPSTPCQYASALTCA